MWTPITVGCACKDNISGMLGFGLIRILSTTLRKLLHLSCYLVILPLADPPILYLSTIVDTHIPYLLSRDKPSLR